MQTPDWEQRFRAARVSLPAWALDAPDRSVLVSNATGTFEIYAWDRTTGGLRQVTDRPNGTSHGAIDPSGEWIWWFADTDGDEFGVWMRQPFDGGTDTPATDLEPAYPAGLALGPDGLALVGQSIEGLSTIHRIRPGEPTVTLYSHVEDAGVSALSRDGRLLAISESEHGDSRHPGLRVLAVTDGRVVGDLWDGPDKGVEALGFSPIPADTRLLVSHERHGRPQLLVWHLATGEEVELDVDLPGEIVADWVPDGRALLVHHEHQARSSLHRLDLTTGSLTPVDTPRGVVSAATARPDGTVEFTWSSAAQPPTVRSSTGAVVLTPPGPPAPASVEVEDLWVDGEGGPIHALVSRPPAGAPPYAAVFLVHGGPTWLDSDSFAPAAAAWVDHGYAVIRVNYRGSTGYGSAWRDALSGQVGTTELADIEAVRAQVLASGLVDPARTVLAGGSWGGYLTLLGLGRAPDLWAAGVAAVPVADYVAAYADEMEGLKAFDRSLFGGSPEEVPDRYRESSPITYVDQVRAPVLILAGANDPRCPIRQIDNYLEALTDHGAEHEVYRFDAGHGSLVVEETIRQQRVELDFVRRHLPS